MSRSSSFTFRLAGRSVWVVRHFFFGGVQVGDLDRRAGDAGAVNALLPAGAGAEEGQVVATEGSAAAETP